MPVVAIDQLLETCRRNGGTEVWLLAGAPPKIRIEGKLHALQHSEIPDAADVEIPLRSIAPDAAREHYSHHGFAEFTYVPHYKGSIPFRVTMLSNAGICLGCFRAELEAGESISPTE